MFENLKNKVKENPVRAKQIGVAVGALIGVAAVAAVIYVYSDGMNLPLTVEDSLEALTE